MNIDPKYIEVAMSWAVVFVPRLLLCALILFVGFFVVRRVMRIVHKALIRAGLDREIADFLDSLIEITCKIAVILIAAGVLGVEMTALIGLLAAAGFAVGLALQGFLGNFAAGLTIIFFKPYRIDDWVQVSDHFGKVRNIQIFNTTLETPNDKTLIIPNGQVTDNIITNFSTKGRMRLELEVRMPYSEKFDHVKKVIDAALVDVEQIHHDPAPIIGIASYDDHSICISVRPYIDPDQYWDATYASYAAIKRAFSEAGIQVAYAESVEMGEIGG